MSAPMDYIEIYNDSELWRIPTTVEYSDSETRNNMICYASDGLFDGGENDSESIERTYSDGSILSPYPRYAGLDFTVDIAIYSLNRTNVSVKNIFENFKYFLTSGNLVFSSNYPHYLNVQTQRIQLQTQDWKGTSRLSLKVFFKAEQAF